MNWIFRIAMLLLAIVGTLILIAWVMAGAPTNISQGYGDELVIIGSALMVLWFAVVMIFGEK